MCISTVVAVAFPPFSLTEGIWICNFVRTLTLVCFAVQRRYHKIDKNNQVDVNVLYVAISYVNLAFKLLRNVFSECESIFISECKSE